MGEVRTSLARLGVLSWRNNVGSLQDATGRYVQYGLAPGSADLIACVPTVFACPHCGSPLPPVGRFVGIEVKGPNTPTRPEQFEWARLVERAHGVAGMAHNVEDARAILVRARRW
jgi:hypothetical protein